MLLHRFNGQIILLQCTFKKNPACNMTKRIWRNAKEKIDPGYSCLIGISLCGEFDHLSICKAAPGTIFLLISCISIMISSIVPTTCARRDVTYLQHFPHNDTSLSNTKNIEAKQHSAE